MAEIGSPAIIFSRPEEVIYSLNQGILLTFLWARVWRMKILYIGDLYKVISKSVVQSKELAVYLNAQ